MIEALSGTVIIEEIMGVLFYLVIKDGKYKYLFLSILGVNLLTNPLLNLVLSLTGYEFIYILIGEVIVVIIEASLYKYLLEYKWERSLLISLVLNLCSFGAGYLLF